MRFFAALVFAGLIMSMMLPGVAGQSASAGKVPYDRACSECHGPDGRGKEGVSATPAIVPLSIDFETLLRVIREGGCEMPKIPADRLSDAEARQIFDYLRSMSTASARTPMRRSSYGC